MFDILMTEWTVVLSDLVLFYSLAKHNPIYNININITGVDTQRPIGLSLAKL